MIWLSFHEDEEEVQIVYLREADYLDKENISEKLVQGEGRQTNCRIILI